MLQVDQWGKVMNILSSISNAASLYSTNAVGTRISEALNKPQQRLAATLESTRVQLSAFGQIKSTTAQLETAAQNLRDSQKVSSLDGLTKAVQGFASAVNSRLSAVDRANSSYSSNSLQANALGTGDASARSAGLEMRRTLEGVAGSNRAALKQMGISVATNGGVTVDNQALQNAFAANPDKVRQTLDKVGQAVAQQSAQQLSNSGSVTSAVTRLTEKLASVEQRQTSNQTLLEQSQKMVSEQEKRLAQGQQVAQQAFVFTGVAAYNRVFSS